MNLNSEGNRNANQVTSRDFEPNSNENNQGASDQSYFNPKSFIAKEMLHAVERNTSSWFDKLKCNFTYVKFIYHLVSFKSISM
jgi:hypothetical protein